VREEVTYEARLEVSWRARRSNLVLTRRDCFGALPRATTRW
jgi:hypothetical protein